MLKNNIEINTPETKTINIKRLGINGEGIGFDEDKITFVPGTLPGETAKVEITQVNTSYQQAKLIELIKTSPNRVKPLAELTTAGGFELAHLGYTKQLEFKRDVFYQSLRKYLTELVNEINILPTIGMKRPGNYRNKLQFPVRKVSNGQIIAGLFEPESHNLISLKNVSTQSKAINDILNSTVAILNKHNVSVWDEKSNKGNLKTIVIREATNSKEVQVTFITKNETFPEKDQIIQDLIAVHPDINSITQNINFKQTSLIWGEKSKVIYGSEYIVENLGPRKYQLSADSFFQLNTKQTFKMYNLVRNLIERRKPSLVVDAYSGVGTIGIFVADLVDSVVGADFNPTNIKNAKANLLLNDISNASYELLDSLELLRNLKTENKKIDSLIVDPPRSGLGEATVKTILETAPSQLIYITCNPSTFAKDLVKLSKDYQIGDIQPFDMFPQTARTEGVCELIHK